MRLSNTEKRLTGGIILIIVLSICLSVTTGALVYATITIEYNVFFTGIVEINLNDGKPVIDEHEFLFEPGMRVVKDFFLESNSSADVYYRIYFAEMMGGLADVLEITVRRAVDDDTVMLVNGQSIPALREDANTLTFGFIMPEADVTIQIGPAAQMEETQPRE